MAQSAGPDAHLLSILTATQEAFNAVLLNGDPLLHTEPTFTNQAKRHCTHCLYKLAFTFHAICNCAFLLCPEHPCYDLPIDSTQIAQQIQIHFKSIGPTYHRVAYFGSIEPQAVLPIEPTSALKPKRCWPSPNTSWL